MKRPARGAAILLSVLAVTLTTAGTRLAGANPPTAGFLFLLVVLFSATAGGLAAGIAASIAASIAFNYFFLPPIHTFHVARADNWVALAAFLVVATVASRLVTRARAPAMTHWPTRPCGLPARRLARPAKEAWFDRLLHNKTPKLIQQRLQWAGCSDGDFSVRVQV